MDASASSPAIWQLAAGDSMRSYADVFLKHGVGLIGPGDAGPWTPERYPDNSTNRLVRRFATEIRPRDVVLLRAGAGTITAVGVVDDKDTYQHLTQFDDVNGWDLQHARRIRWCKLPQEHTFPGKVFGANPPRCSRVWSKEVTDYAERFLNSPPTHWQQATLPPLPLEEPSLERVPAELETLVAQARDLASLYWDTPSFGELPAEDELIVHFVVPFLRQLGWPPERISVKWRRIDVATFSALPRNPANCRFIIEAKRFGAGVEGALGQAKGYIADLGVPRDIVVTDGIRYRMYSGADGFAPIAYANLFRLKHSALRLFEKMRNT